MDDEVYLTAVARQPALGPPLAKRWEARLSLQYDYLNNRSYLANKQHYGPLVIQKSLYPEGPAICHGLIIHPPGGVAGGDELSIDVKVTQNAHALLTTPGAGKWYKANGQDAKQHLTFHIEDQGTLEWLPQENILFDEASVQYSVEVNLAESAQYAAWEILCFGRQARNEKWKRGRLKQQASIYRSGRLIWNERAFVNATDKVMQSPVGLNGAQVCANFVVASGKVPATILEACRAVKPAESLDPNARFGVTALPDIFAARYIGQSSQCAKNYFEKLWAILRPWYASTDMVRPRIWNT